MRKRWISYLVVAVAAGMAFTVWAKPRIYKWVKDKRVSSELVLQRSQFQRVVPVTEGQTQELVKQVMTDDLYLALAQYHTTKHQQDAETTVDSALPEEVVKQATVDLIDEDYRFVLEVQLKKFGSRTRVTAKAWPVYRLRDLEAEDARDEDNTAGNSIEVKVRADQGNAVALGPMVIAPILGIPGDYGITPLPDGAERAAELVRSFMYLLDRRVSQARPRVSQPVQPVSAGEADQAQGDSAPATQIGSESAGSGTEVDIKMQSR
ncbi:MAG: hypothetical protein AB1439_00890 [candidate division FCPU426 bacterium]